MPKSEQQKTKFGQWLNKVQNAIYEKEIFIGYMMLCRYLNNGVYQRYGCNAGYGYRKDIPKSDPRNRINPCKTLCPGSKIYNTRVRYAVLKLVDMGYVYIKKMSLLDSLNEDIPEYRKMPRWDIFTVIASTKNILNQFILEEKNKTYEILREYKTICTDDIFGGN